MVCMLGVVLPVAFGAGIAARRPVPAATSVPSGLAAQAGDFGHVLWSDADLFPGHQIITRLRGDANGGAAVELMFSGLTRPDVLVYWSSGDEAIADKLPEDAQLLGALSNAQPLPVPAKQRGQPGRLVLYSLADHEVVAVSKEFQTLIHTNEH